MRFILPILCAVSLVSCSLHPAPSIMKIRSLGERIVTTESLDNNGRIDGLERTSVDQMGKIQANVLIVHGMGWAQMATPDDRFGFDFVEAVEAAYGVHGTIDGIKRLCPQYTKDARRDERYLPGGLKIVAEPDTPALQTDAPNTRLWIGELACMDRIVIDLGNKGSINVYRLFWDDAFYNAYEYRLLGYDDGIFLGQEASDRDYRGYEDINGLRTQLNKQLKNEVVTYGFSDATMYLGPAGQQIREALRGGLCAAINEATGHTHLFQQFQSNDLADRQNQGFVGPSMTTRSLCAAAVPAKAAPLTIITKSLGSRAMFDTLTQDLHPELATKLQQISNEKLEVFMFANQIPLLGVGKLKPIVGADTPPVSSRKKMRFIGVSEVNDLLTYELVPYFEHLYQLRCMAGQNCNLDYFRRRVSDFRSDADARRAYVEELGFDVIDVRARFAANMIPFVPFVNPLAAHGGHLKVEPVRRLFLCGADAGKPRMSGCQAR